MVASEQKKRASQGKPHFLKYLPHVKLSNHEQSMVIKEALLYIDMLKLKIKALQRESEDFKIVEEDPLNQFQGVKVDKIGESFQVNIKCIKGENNLVNILEAFEEMGLSVAQARASCLDLFVMEAIVAPQSKDKLCSVDDLTQALVKALLSRQVTQCNL